MSESNLQRAIFAGGCFWCMEPPFEKLPGVIRVVAGYTGGESANPRYEEVCSGRSGHAEAVEVHFDPQRVGYTELLETFWRNINPTDPDGQFADRGSQYRTAIFYLDDEQRRLAVASRESLAASGTFASPIVTEVVPAGPFYPAEDYHQGYAHTNPLRYGMYRQGSGRERFLQTFWGKPPKDRP